MSLVQRPRQALRERGLSVPDAAALWFGDRRCLLLALLGLVLASACRPSKTTPLAALVLGGAAILLAGATVVFTRGMPTASRTTPRAPTSGIRQSRRNTWAWSIALAVVFFAGTMMVLELADTQPTPSPAGAGEPEGAAGGKDYPAPAPDLQFPMATPAAKAPSYYSCLGVIDRWMEVQEDVDLEGYAALYSSTFRGVVLASGRRLVFSDRASWLEHRLRMLRARPKASILDLHVVPSRTGAEISFTQVFHGQSSGDMGRKEISLRLEDEHLRIVREEMITSRPIGPLLGASMVATSIGLSLRLDDPRRPVLRVEAGAVHQDYALGPADNCRVVSGVNLLDVSCPDGTRERIWPANVARPPAEEVRFRVTRPHAGVLLLEESLIAEHDGGFGFRPVGSFDIRGDEVIRGAFVVSEPPPRCTDPVEDAKDGAAHELDGDPGTARTEPVDLDGNGEPDLSISLSGTCSWRSCRHDLYLVRDGCTRNVGTFHGKPELRATKHHGLFDVASRWCGIGPDQTTQVCEPVVVSRFDGRSYR